MCRARVDWYVFFSLHRWSLIAVGWQMVHATLSCYEVTMLYYR